MAWLEWRSGSRQSFWSAEERQILGFWQGLGEVLRAAWWDWKESSQQALLINAIYKAAYVTFRSPELWQQHEAMMLPRGN